MNFGHNKDFFFIFIKYLTKTIKYLQTLHKTHLNQMKGRHYYQKKMERIKTVSMIFLLNESAIRQ